MTLEIRRPADVEVAPAPWRRRARQHLVTRRAAVVAVSRARAWSAWRVARQAPGVVCLLAWWSPRGAWRLVVTLARWVRDDDTADLRHHHAGARETPDLERVHRVRSATLHARLLVLGLAVAVGGGLILAWTAPDVLAIFAGVVAFAGAARALPWRNWGPELALSGGAGLAVWAITPGLAERIPHPPGWLVTLAAVAAMLVCGWVGRPIARPLVTLPGVAEGGRVPPLTAPMVTAALCELGSAKMREPDSVRLLMDVARRGPGYQVDMELPVPVTWVMDRREELATALRRELGTVWPSVGARHPGHLVLYVADQPMSLARQAPWPLLHSGSVDLFRPVPVATDQTGAWVEVTLAYASGVIGAVPRMGKTFLLRELLLIAGLDPRARVYAFDGKGTGDLSACEPFAHYIGVGDEPEDVAEQLEVMRGLRRELRRRARALRELPREECPESKVTSALADRRELGLEPIVIGVDETQVWFEYGEKGSKADKAIRQEFAAICTDLAKRGPALGFTLLLATQLVTADTIPTSVSNVAVIRFALKLLGHVANDQVLGTGARRAGIDATMFSVDDKGVGYLLADGADARIVRTVAGLDAVAAERVAQRARSLREAAGRLTGQADAVEAAIVVLDEVADVERALTDRGRAAAHLAELVDWLGEARPEYAGLTVDELGVRLRNRGITTRQVKVAGVNRRGIRMVDLRERCDDEVSDPCYPGIV